MINNVLFILAEGEHDTAFLYRILRVNGFTNYKSTIKDYPKPLNEFLLSGIAKVSFSDTKLQEARRGSFLPSYAMVSETNLIIIYSIGGDSRSDLRTSIIKSLNAFNVEDEDALQAYPNANLSVLYFFDADDKGTEYRMNQTRDELILAFPDFDFEDTYNASTFYTIEDMEIGAYIFREVDNDKGMLEDILIPLMKDGNDDVFEAAETFLEIKTTCTLYKDKLKYDKKDATLLKKVSSDKYYHKKSLIGTIGQLQKSGKSNTVCISDADYITEAKILENATCIEIIDLIKTVMI